MSGDMATLTDQTWTTMSNFLIYEDAQDYTQLWAKEFQSLTNRLKFTQVQIDLAQEIVYVASWENSAYLLAIDGTTGQTLLGKFFIDAQNQPRKIGQIKEIVWIPAWQRLIILVIGGGIEPTKILRFTGALDPDPLQLDEQIEFSHGGYLEQSFSQPALRVYQDSENLPYNLIYIIENSFTDQAVATTHYTGYYKLSYLQASSVPPNMIPTTSSLTVFNIPEVMSPIAYHIDSTQKEIVLGCLQSFDDNNNLTGANVQLMYKNDIFSQPFKQYDIFSSSATTLGAQYNCRNAEVTSDHRAFIYLTVRASFPSNDVRDVITEIIQSRTGGMQGVVTYLYKHKTTTTMSMNQKFTIISDSKGQSKMLFFFSGRQLNDEQTIEKIMGYVMLESLGGPFGARPLLDKVECNFPTTWYMTQAIQGISVIPSAYVITNAPLYYNIAEDNLLSLAASQIKLIYQDLAATRIRKPEYCPSAVSGSVPLHLPYIEERIYYVIGLDPLTKSFSFTLNPKYLALSKCQKRLLSFDITSRDDLSPIPRFIQFIRDPPSLQINRADIPADHLLEYPMKLVLSDISGNRAALFFTVLILWRDTLLDECLIDQNVVKKPFALDHIYVIGSLWRHNIHIPRPRTLGLLDCSSKLIVVGRIINTQGFYEQFPIEIRTDIQYPRLTVHVPKNLRELYDGKNFRINVVVHIYSQVVKAQSVTFNLNFVSEQPLGCPLYQNLVAPQLENHYILSSQITQEDINFDDFLIFSSACERSMQSNFRKQLTQTDGSPLPSCMTYEPEANKLNILPIVCPATGITNQALYIELKFEAWFENFEGVPSNFKASNNFTTFEIIIVNPNSCKGYYLFPTSSNSLTQVVFDQEYINTDAQVQIVQRQYQCSLYNQQNQQVMLVSFQGCLTGSSAVKLQNGLSFEPPDFISLQAGVTVPNWKIDPISFDLETDGIYYLRALMWYETTTSMPPVAPYYQFAPGTVNLDLHMYSEKSCLMDSGNNRQNLKYIVRRETTRVTYQLSRFRMAAEKCIYDRVSYQVHSVDNGGQWLILPPFVQHEPSLLTLTVETNDTTALGIYHLLLFGSLNPYLNHTYHFTLELEIYPNTDAPTFIQQIKSPVNVSLHEDKSYKLPLIKDPDNDRSFIVVNYIKKGISTAQLPSFITFDMFTRQFKINPTELEHIGSYQFKIDLIDDHPDPKKRSYPFKIIVSTFNGSAALLSQLERDEAKKYRHVRVMPMKVDSSGVLMLKFDQHVFQPGNTNKTLEQFNLTFISNVMIEKAYSETTQNLEWKVEKLTNDTAYIKLLFQNPSQVSLFEEKDRLLFKIIKGKQIRNSLLLLEKSDEKIIPSHRNLTDQFVATENLDLNKYLFLTIEGKECSITIPRQKRESGFDETEGVFVYLKASINTILFGNLLLNILFSSSLQMLWGTINTMQLIMMVTLFNLSFPENAMFTFKLISQITRFNLIPLDKVINAMFSFDETEAEPINYNFDMMGYEETSILQTLDSILAFLTINLGLMALTPFVFWLIRCFPRQGFRFLWFSKMHWYLKLKNTVFFNMTIRVFLESFIEIALTAAINLLNLRFKIFGDAFSSYLSMVLGSMILIFPIIVLVFTAYNRDRIEDISIQEKYGAFYEGLRLKNYAQQLCTFLFTVRRLILVASIVLLSDHPGLQVMLFILFSQLTMIYIIHCKPYEDRTANLNEAFNELCILSTSYTLFIFCDQVEDYGIRNFAGFLIIAIILVNFAVNLVIQFIQVLSKLRLTLKLVKAKLEKKLRSAGYLLQDQVQKAPCQSQEQMLALQEQQCEKQQAVQLPHQSLVKQLQKQQPNFLIWPQDQDLFLHQLGEVKLSTLEMPPETGTSKMLWRLSQEKKNFDAENEKEVDEVSRNMIVLDETTTPIKANDEKLTQLAADLQPLTDQAQIQDVSSLIELTQQIKNQSTQLPNPVLSINRFAVSPISDTTRRHTQVMQAKHQYLSKNSKNKLQK